VHDSFSASIPTWLQLSHLVALLLILPAAFTQRPSIGYGLAESQGDVAAASSGQYAVGEFGYNPISNNLGLSGAAGASDSLNVAQGDLAIPTESE
jgi:hypothetical protein